MESKLNREEVARVCGMYLGCRVKVGGSRKYHKLVGISEGQCRLTGSQGFTRWYPISECQLILTPLEDITDEDVEALARIAKLEGKIDIHRGDFAINVYDESKRRLLFYHRGSFSNTRIFDKNGFEVIEYCIDIIDFLRSRSYALPYRGVDLVASGIAVYKKII
jgi:hypothetical protein